ncbi:MAG: T9SS type A sorting domain-containing protein [Saprospiraceae bacterium]|nr:T9SS type A sorting domain-containing protein [Saprospiraceae bacterium]
MNLPETAYSWMIFCPLSAHIFHELLFPARIIPGARMFSLQGKRVGPSFEGVLDADRQEFEWALDSLPSGTYFLRLQNRGEFEVEQMVVK